MMRSRILLGVLFGAIGGFVGFLLQESVIPHNLGLSLPVRYEMLCGLLVGAMIGMGIGAVEGAAIGSTERVISGARAGAVIGAVGGVLGIYLGEVLYSIALFGQSPLALESRRGLLDFAHMVIARALGWTFVGALPGLAAGAATRSRKRALHGLAGGLIGGFLGGILFDLVGTLLAAPVLAAGATAASEHMVETGGPSRAIGFTGIGLFAGLMIGLVDEVLKQAWVRVLAGEREGRDIIITNDLTVFGRSERVDVPLYGDPSLAAQHGAIRREGNRHTLFDGGSAPTCIVNGQPVGASGQLLRDGDMIQMGQVRVLFHEKATAARIASPRRDPDVATAGPSAVPMPGHLCPFCGAPRDASGACQCSVGALAPASTAAPIPGAYATGPDPTRIGAPMPAGGGFAAAAALTVIEGPQAGQAFPLQTPSTEIGREPGCAISLPTDRTISRRHAHIAMENGGHVLYDDGSANGTFVNGVRVSVQALAAGDVVQVGATKLRYA